MLDGASRIGDVVAAAAAGRAARRSASPTTATCTASSTCTAPRATPASPRSSAPSSTRRTSTAPSVPRGATARSTTPGGEVEGGRKAYYHLTALAETLTGYRNLIQLSSRAYLEGYYQKPKVDWELLEAHHEGIIATTGCLGGQVLQALLQGRRGRRARGRGSAAGHLRAREPVRRAAGPRDRRPAADEPEADGDRARRSTRRCSPRTTATTRTRATRWRTTRCCACRPTRRSTRRSASASTATSTT